MDNMNTHVNLTIDLNRPLLKEGPDFLSHKVIIKTNEYAYLRPTITAMLFCMVYIVIGSCLIGLAIYLLIMSIKYDLVIFVGGFGIAITTFGLTLIQPFLRRASFDKTSGVFDNRRDRDVKLHHITSLQINNKRVQRKHALSYHCFELNLLTEHGRRINLLNHNNEAQLLNDAQLLAAFLNVEITDCRREIIL
ncbi:hypothetical protein N8878_07255 [Psychromonas sp.]|nr:hypothetical protein [Psychromonas sp.]